MLAKRKTHKSDRKRHRNMKASEIFRLRINELLNDRGLSARALGAMAGLSHNTIHRILTGKNAASIDTVQDIAHALGVPISLLLGEVGKDHGLEECYRRVHRDRPSQRKAT